MSFVPGCHITAGPWVGTTSIQLAALREENARLREAHDCSGCVRYSRKGATRVCTMCSRFARNDLYTTAAQAPEPKGEAIPQPSLGGKPLSPNLPKRDLAKMGIGSIEDIMAEMTGKEALIYRQGVADGMEQAKADDKAKGKSGEAAPAQEQGEALMILRDALGCDSPPSYELPGHRERRLNWKVRARALLARKPAEEPRDARP